MNVFRGEKRRNIKEYQIANGANPLFFSNFHKFKDKLRLSGVLTKTRGDETFREFDANAIQKAQNCNSSLETNVT